VGWLLVAGCPVIFALATWPGAAFPGQDTIRHYSLPILAVELAVVVLAFRQGFQPGRALATAPGWVGGALALLGVIAIGTALLVAPDKPSAMLRTCSSIMHVLFALALGHLFNGVWRSLSSRIWASIAIGTLGYGAILVAYVSSIADPIAHDWLHFRLAVTHVRQLGFYSVVGACAAFGLAVTSANKRTYWTWLTAAGILLALSFWSGTRSSLVAFAAAFVISLRLFPSLRRPRAWNGLLSSMLLGLGIGLLHQVPHWAFGPLRLWAASGGEDPGSGRLEVWLGALRVYLERPLFGFGESQFRLLVPEGHGLYNHPHNAVLQILFQWGLAGAACYFALAAFVWLRFEKAVRQTGNAALPAYLVAVSLVTYSLFEGTLYHPYPIAMLAVAVASVLATYTPARALNGRQFG
jgi:O-antigen ligase